MTADAGVGGAGPGHHDHRWRSDRRGREPGHRPSTGRRQPAGRPDEHALGGAGANSALAFADSGAKPRLVGCAGDDHLGAWMCNELKAFGLDRDLLTIAGERSGLTLALQSPDRDRTFITYLGVNATMEPISAAAWRSDPTGPSYSSPRPSSRWPTRPVRATPSTPAWCSLSTGGRSTIVTPGSGR